MGANFRTFFVVNPNAANCRTGRMWPGMEKRFATLLGDVGVGFTTAPGDATHIALEAIEDGYGLIVSVGGDGTNNEVVNAFFNEDGSLVTPDAAFGFISLGTGGDFRRSLGIERGEKGAESTLPGIEVKRIDVGRMTYTDHNDKACVKYFANIASFGVGGLVDEYVNRSTKFLGGKVSFMLGTIKALRKYRNQTVRLKVDDKLDEEMVINNVAVANGQFFGGGMHVAPHALLDDGLFDVVILGDLNFREILKGSRKLYKGTHLDQDKIRWLRGKKVIAESDDRVLIDMDGEQPGKLPATFEVLPKALRLKVPGTS